MENNEMNVNETLDQTAGATATPETVTETPTTNPISAENVTAFLMTNTDVLKDVLGQEFAKSVLQPITDSHVSRGIETWKKNNLEKIVNERIAELNPNETPEQKQIRELSDKLNQSIAQQRHKELEVTKRDILAETNLPLDFAKYVTGDSEESLRESAKELHGLLSASVTNLVGKQVEERFKKGSHIPKADTPQKPVVKPFLEMSVRERTLLAATDPKAYEAARNAHYRVK